MSRAWRGGSTTAWRKLRRLILDRDGHRCQLPVVRGMVVQPCGERATHVDHITPKSLGGQDVPANLRAACASCNLSRGAGRGARVEDDQPRTVRIPRQRGRHAQPGPWSW